MQQTMSKLNTLGAVVKPKNGGGQIINVTYGHHGSGKLYSYYGTNKRVGDIVTPEVTHPKSHKTYKTLAVVKSTHSIGNGRDTIDYLQKRQQGALGQMIDKPRGLKYIGKTDQTSLPGYQPYKNKGGADAWAKDAKAAYDLKLETMASDMPQMQKLSTLREIQKMRRN